MVFENNDRVGYAYWLNESGCVVADMWLCNRCETPTEPEWIDSSRAPFANPLPYASKNCPFDLPKAASDVQVDWINGRSAAKVIINGQFAGLLEAGAKPGWAAMAAEDGPLARVAGS